jgi:hypothetical protein
VKGKIFIRFIPQFSITLQWNVNGSCTSYNVCFLVSQNHATATNLKGLLQKGEQLPLVPLGPVNLHIRGTRSGSISLKKRIPPKTFLEVYAGNVVNPLREVVPRQARWRVIYVW